jgi:hypothetical protein
MAGRFSGLVSNRYINAILALTLVSGVAVEFKYAPLRKTLGAMYDSTIGDFYDIGEKPSRIVYNGPVKRDTVHNIVSAAEGFAWDWARLNPEGPDMRCSKEFWIDWLEGRNPKVGRFEKGVEIVVPDLAKYAGQLDILQPDSR